MQFIEIHQCNGQIYEDGRKIWRIRNITTVPMVITYKYLTFSGWVEKTKRIGAGGGIFPLFSLEMPIVKDVCSDETGKDLSYIEFLFFSQSI